MTPNSRVLILHAVIGRIDFALSILHQVREAQAKLYAEQVAELTKKREQTVTELANATKEATPA